jgi:hypothetical protein
MGSSVIGYAEASERLGAGLNGIKRKSVWLASRCSVGISRRDECVGASMDWCWMATRPVDGSWSWWTRSCGRRGHVSDPKFGRHITSLEMCSALRL